MDQREQVARMLGRAWDAADKMEPYYPCGSMADAVLALVTKAQEDMRERCAERMGKLFASEQLNRRAADLVRALAPREIEP